MKSRIRMVAVIGMAVVAVCGLGIATRGESAPTKSLESRSVGAWGVDLSDRDNSVKPGDDFFMSQNGGWFTRTELSPAQPASAYWRDLRRLSPVRMIAVLEELSANKAISAETPQSKAAAFYRSFMDEKIVEAKAITPLQPRLAAIRAAKTKAQLAELMGQSVGPYTFRAPQLRVTSLGFVTARGFFTINVAQDQ